MNQVALEKFFYDHFKNLNNVNNDHDGVFNFDIHNSYIDENSELKRSFSKYDILQAEKSLKNHKSCAMI